MSLMNYTEDHETKLRAVLVRGKVLGPRAELPPPHDVASGHTGKSRVYFVTLPEGLRIIAKFDPEGGPQEWRVLSQLGPQAALRDMLPENWATAAKDGVIWYRDEFQAARAHRMLTFSQLVRAQLAKHPQHCAQALNLAFERLLLLHEQEPGRLKENGPNGQPMRWRDFFPELSHQEAPSGGFLARWRKMLESAQVAWPGLDWDQPTLELPLGATTRSVPNPLAGLAALVAAGQPLEAGPSSVGKNSVRLVLAELLRAPTGRVAVSRVHGDLNLANIVVGVNALYVPQMARIIDPANSQPQTATAMDFTRFESLFWPEACAATGASPPDPAECLAAFVAMRDQLDGRVSPFAIPHSPFAAFAVVRALRQQAVRVLGKGEPDHGLEDFYHALCLNHLKVLSWSHKDPLPAQLALLGAALSLQVLEDLHAGRYAEGAPQGLTSPAVACQTLEERAQATPPSSEQAAADGDVIMNIGVVHGRVIGKQIIQGDQYNDLRS